MFFCTARPVLQAARNLFSIARNEWIRSPIDVYKPGKCLLLTLPHSDQPAEVQIIKAFTPFTNSVALLVEARSESLPSSFLLKLADRRVCFHWNPDKEEDYQLKIQPLGPTITLDPNEEFLPWMDMFDSWETYEALHVKEREAYSHLVEAQTLGLIPRFFGPTKINMLTRSSHPSLKYINGLMIEYIPGRNMSSLRPGINITIQEAEVLSQRILELGRRLRRYGVCHNDIHVGNIIFRAGNNFPVLIDWGKASIEAPDLPLQQRWKNQQLRQDFHFDIRYVLQTGAYYEGPNQDAVYPDIPAGGVWHRYRTPISDEDQIRLAQDQGYDAANHFIQALLSKEELGLLYDEDVSVDINHGLRWKVKKGVKTRGHDDPCPVV